MTSPPPESSGSESRLAALERRMEALEDAGPRGGSFLDRVLRYLPYMALGNLFVAAPAMIISIVVAYFAFEQADATKKMQVSSVWPILSYDTGNLSEDGEPEITFNLSNRGVGPARVGGMQVSYDGTAYRSIQDLMRDCCAPRGERVGAIVSAVNGEVIPAGARLAFARIDPVDLSPRSYARMEAARLKVRTQICYCSVFDDCWIEDSQMTGTEPVNQCPADWVQFGFPIGVKPGG